MAIKKIVCCTDFSKNSEKAFIIATDMAERYQAELSVVHVMPPVVNPMVTDTEWVLPIQSEKSLILKLEERMQQEYGARVGNRNNYKLVVLSGHVSSEILKYLEENQIDLVIVGAFGLTGMGLVLFGSVAKRISHKARCSVMIVRDLEEDQDQL